MPLSADTQLATSRLNAVRAPFSLDSAAIVRLAEPQQCLWIVVLVNVVRQITTSSRPIVIRSATHIGRTPTISRGKYLYLMVWPAFACIPSGSVIRLIVRIGVADA